MIWGARRPMLMELALDSSATGQLPAPDRRRRYSSPRSGHRQSCPGRRDTATLPPSWVTIWALLHLRRRRRRGRTRMMRDTRHVLEALQSGLAGVAGGGGEDQDILFHAP